MEKYFPCKWEASDKIDLKIKKITRDKEGGYITIKRSIQEEDITIVNIYAPSIEALQNIRQALTDIKGEIITGEITLMYLIHTIIVGDFNTRSHQWTDHQNRKLIRKHKS